MALAESVKRRFWKYVYPNLSTPCWLWHGSIAKRGGYGQINDRGKLLKAHRVAYEIQYGEIPKGLFICHKCNNPRCCNPFHLYAGTAKDNWNDTVKTHGLRLPKNAPAGEQHHSAKLKISDIKYIRSSSDTGAALARKFGVSKTLISRIRKFKIWRSEERFG